MIILDTNVVSELMRPEAELKVRAWADGVRRAEQWITTVTAMELLEGALGLPAGRRRTHFVNGVEHLLRRSFASRILSFDLASAEAAAALAVERARQGRRIEIRDTQIAGIAIAHNARLATRNIRHFRDLPVEVIDPWTHKA